MKKCPICLKVCSNLDEHHVIPREVVLNGIKGEEGPVVYICPTCHQGCHSQAKALNAKSRSKKVYFDPESMDRAAPYVKILVAALQTETSINSKRKIIVEVTAGELELLHIIKKDNGYTSLDKFVHDVLLATIRKHI